MIRIAWTYAVMIAATVFTGGRAILYSVAWRSRFDRLAHGLTGEWGTIVLWGAGTKLVVRNRERIGRKRGQILVANHQSWFDIFAIGAALRDNFAFVGKRELSRIPILGGAWERVGNIAIDRSDRQAAMASLAKVDALVREGRTIVMFPEGTRSATGELGRFKKGAFVMAIKSQVPLLPVAVQGTRDIMKKGSWRISRGTATVVVGHPICTRGMTLKDRNDLSRRCREAVLNLLRDEG